MHSLFPLLHPKILPSPTTAEPLIVSIMRHFVVVVVASPCCFDNGPRNKVADDCDLKEPADKAHLT